MGNLLLQKDWTPYLYVGLPIGGLACAYKLSTALLHPLDAEKKGLYQWRDYPTLRLSAICTMLLIVVGLLSSIGLAAFRTALTPWWMGTIYTLSSVVWLVSLATLGLARLTLPSILGGEP